MNFLHQLQPVLKFIFPSDLAVSVVFTCIVCRVIGISCALVSLAKWTSASTPGRLLSFGPVKLFVVALHENVEERPFLGRRIFDSLM
jgi:hypothetical protein